MYKISALILLLLGLSFSMPSPAFAIPAAPDIFEIKQQNGNSFNAIKKGDEWNNRVETEEGYTVNKGSDGFWHYISRFSNDMPVLDSTLAHSKPPRGLKKHIRKAKKFRNRPAKFSGDVVKTASSAPSATESVSQFSSEAPPLQSPPAAFNGAILFILAEFNNVSGTYSEASFGAFINNNISDYFDKASYGVVTLSPANETSGTSNNGVVDWVNVGYNHPNNTNKQQLAKDAIAAADPYVDYSAYDNDGDGYVDADELAIVVIAAGYECAYGSYSPCMWGHRSSLDSVVPPVLDGVTVGDYHGSRGGYAEFGEKQGGHQATMGIMVHELGHLVFNLPDLYDTDGSSEGIGAFGVMGGGSWGRSSSATYSGETPVLPCAWSKYSLGWVDGTESTGAVSITAAGSSSANRANTVYKVLTNSASEYFWVENRQSLGYDAGLYSQLGAGFGGLAIWHIDKNIISGKINTNSVNTSECYPGGPSCVSDHFGIAIEQADGNWDIDKDTNRGNSTDLWYSGNQTAFDSLSTPDSKLYNNSLSGVSVTNIGASGEIMTATLSSPAVTIFEDRFESGSLGAEWSTNSTNEGRILVTRNNSPYTGKYHITMDDSVQGSATSLNELILTLDLTSRTGVKLSFFQMEIGDEDHPMPSSFTGSNNSDGVAISADGNTWFRVVDLGIPSTAWVYSMYEVDLDTAIASAGISYNSTFKIKFQQYDNFPINYDGFAFDVIEVFADQLSCTDNDEDGYGDPGNASCLNGSQTDCDDTDPNNYPGNTEVCDNLDNNCNVSVDENLTRPTSCGVGECGSSGFETCSAGTWGNDTCTPGTPSTEICDNLDNDCNSQTDEGLQYQLTTSVNPAGNGSVNPDYSAGQIFDCMDSVILNAIEDNGYPFNSWTGCDSPSNSICTMTMDAVESVIAGFDFCMYPARVPGTTTYYFPLFQNALNNASYGDTVESQSYSFTENITFNNTASITLNAGYTCDYSNNTGITFINGNMIINAGAITIQSGTLIVQ